MGKTRLEAFSDGVIAIIITVMVLEIKAPRGSDFAALMSLLPPILIYTFSFVFIGVYWNSHHHLLHATPRVNGRILWANLHVLFWLSLMPIATNWLGQNYAAPLPTAVYGVLMLMAAIAFRLLLREILSVVGHDSLLAKEVGKDRKGLASVLLCVVGVAFAFVQHWVSDVLFVLLTVIWLVPDPRMTKAVGSDRG